MREMDLLELMHLKLLILMVITTINAAHHF